MERRFVGWAEFGKLAEELAAKIEASGQSYDLLVGVARGGIPAALRIANRIRIGIDFVNIKSYECDGTRRRPKILSTLIEDARNRRILVVDDIVDSGETLKTVVDWLGRQGAKAVETATLFVKPWSDFVPTYSVGAVEEWIVFPWEEER